MKPIYIILAVLFTAIGILIGYKLLPNETKIIQSPKTFQSDLISPVIGFDLEIEKPDPKISLLEKDLNDFINNQISETDKESASLFFRELSYGGSSFGINSNQTFAPASLFKIPLMMAYFKEAESDPEILSKKILYSVETGLNQHEFFTARKYIQPGNEYTVQELIEYMIIYSDNEATSLLKNNLGDKISNRAYEDLGINVPENQPEAEFITVRAYASFFRILYSSTYLDEEYSAKALEILNQADFKIALRKPIPDEIRVAHKFGERGNMQNGIKQLHDCGIVYFPKHPYSLCIMTRGTDYQKQAELISEISRMVYERMKSIYAKSTSLYDSISLLPN